MGEKLVPKSYCDANTQGKYFQKALETNDPTDFLIAYVFIGDRRLLHQAIFVEKTDVNAKLKDGTSALHMAARVGNIHVLRWLIEEAGAFINIKNSAGYTPAHFASKYLINRV